MPSTASMAVARVGGHDRRMAVKAVDMVFEN
jgi:hypothetical protein